MDRKVVHNILPQIPLKSDKVLSLINRLNAVCKCVFLDKYKNQLSPLIICNYDIKLAVHLYFVSLLFYVLIFKETTQQQSTFTVSYVVIL